MDEHNNDPYEQQLYAVFQSCLTKGETELQEDDWLTLCQKLDLTEQSNELKSCIQWHKSGKQSISFQEFRTALLTLLGKTQDLFASSEKDTDPSNVDTKRCELLLPSDSNSNADILNMRAGVTLDENRLKTLWEKINSSLKDNVDSSTMYFISNCLGIPALPKQITQCIFEKLDQNCDGLINSDEFFVIFENKKTLQEQSSLDSNEESMKGLGKSDLKKCSYDILTPRKTSSTRSNPILDMWKVATITNASSLLADGEFKASDVHLADLTATLCDELKNLNESLDSSAIRSHITLLRNVLILYQEELHSSKFMIDNINGEKEKLRIDMIEANERANSLAQEIDEQHIRQEGIVQSLRKQIEQHHAEIVQDLSNQLTSEREINAAAVKSKEDQIQSLQKENIEVRSKFVNTLQDNQILETENENLRSHIEKLKHTNNELLTQMKVLAAEHDETQNIEVKHQEEVIYLIDRIKQLQSEAVLLRDQNDELTSELESLKLRDCYTRDTRQDNLSGAHITKSIQSDESEDKDAFMGEEETDFDIFLKHSTPISCASNEEENTQSYRKTDVKNLKEVIVKQLKNALANNNKCTLENCLYREEISTILNRLQTNVNTHTIKDTDFVKSIASEMETECEERTTESLRDFVVPKQKKSVHAKRAAITNNNTDVLCNVDDNFNNQDSKGTLQNKVPSLRDYPPRKEEHVNADHGKQNKEKELSLNHSAKVTNEINIKNNSYGRSESIEDVATTSLKFQENEVTLDGEKKQLTERCLVLERSLDLLKTEYEECEDYWAAKLEEERQLFEQEQKISDEKLSELIAKMAEYEELISPVDKVKNNGRLSPIEEKFNLEQQYLDLEEEYEKWKAQMEEEIAKKDKEIEELREKLKSLKRPAMTDTFVQVTNDSIFPSWNAQSTYVPTSSFSMSPSNDSASKLAQCSENIRKLPEEYKLNRILESSVFSNEFVPQVAKEGMPVPDYLNSHQIRMQYPTKEGNSTCKIEKPGSHWKKGEINGKSNPLIKEDARHNDYDFVQDAFKLQNLRTGQCQCTRSDTQQVCCVDINILKNLNMKLQVQERKKQQLHEYYKRQQHHIEQVLHRIISQHRIEVSELQCLLHTTQDKLQTQFQINVEQAERLTRADVLVKDLYIENACLTADVKHLQQHCHILTGCNAESTSI